jgi:hypothetical protein
MIRPAAFALLALGTVCTISVQLCPGGNVPSRHSMSVVFKIALDCVHVPPDESVIDRNFALVGKCSTRSTPFAFIDPRFLTCHVTVPLLAPST